MKDDPQSPVRIASVPSDVEAAAIVTALAAHGIEAKATGGFSSGFRAEAPGEIGVVVRAADCETAAKLLAEIRDEIREIDWSSIDVGTPEPEA